MKYLYSWLKEFYPELPSIKECEELLIQLGHDVSTVTLIDYAGIVVGEITEVAQHPNADRLSVISINDGATSHTVVCGAPNLYVGQKVAYAPLGTLLPCGLSLKPRKIRDVESVGMACAPDELGLSHDHDGLLTLPENAIPGTPIHTYIGMDAVFDCDLTPNRGDVMSHFGMARDLAAASYRLLESIPQISWPDKNGLEVAKIHDDAPALSLGQFTLPEAPTPLFYVSRLTLLGVKCSNLASDLTNYAMIAYGQPLHAYDSKLLPQPNEFAIRRAHDGERFVGLNSRTYSLSPQNLLITVADQPVALAGVIGSDATKTSPATRTIIVESARFNPKAITISARGTDTLTDAALRFERMSDPAAYQTGLSYFASLVISLGGTVTSYLSTQSVQVPTIVPITTSYASLGDKLGVVVDEATIYKHLTGLGCTISPLGESSISVTPPAWRNDLNYPEDLVEECARLLGLNTLPKVALPPSVPQWKRSAYWRNEYIKDLLIAQGAYEVSTYPFVSDPTWKGEPAQRIDEPPFKDKQYMRLSLIPGLLEVIANNPETPLLIVFELAHIYPESGEVVHLAISVSGNNQTDIDHWWQNLFERFHLPVSSWMSRVQTIDEEVRTKSKIRKSVVTMLEIDPQDVSTTVKHDIVPVAIPDVDAITITPLSKYQTSHRDISVIIDKSVDLAEVAATLVSPKDYCTEAIYYIDTFAPKVEENQHIAMIKVTYQAPDHTLTKEELKTAHSRVESILKEHYHATIR